MKYLPTPFMFAITIKKTRDSTKTDTTPIISQKWWEMDSSAPPTRPDTQQKNPTQKKIFFEKLKFFILTWKNNFSHFKKKFLVLSQKAANAHLKKTKTLQLKVISYNDRKSKKFLILIRKTHFLYFREKVKVLQFRCVLNTATQYFSKN